MCQKLIYGALVRVQTGRAHSLSLSLMLSTFSSLLPHVLTHNCLSLSGAVNWYQLLTSAGHIYPLAHRQTFNVNLSSRWCPFKYEALSDFSSFMLLFCVRPPSPRHCPVFIDFPASLFHQPYLSQRSQLPPPSFGLHWGEFFLLLKIWF